MGRGGQDDRILLQVERAFQPDGKWETVKKLILTYADLNVRKKRPFLSSSDTATGKIDLTGVDPHAPRAKLAELFSDAQGTLIHDGDDLPGLKEEIDRLGLLYVRQTSHSPNTQPAQVEEAARLGEEPLQPDRTVILSALPQGQMPINPQGQGWLRALWGWAAPIIESWRMRLPLSQRNDWGQVNAAIRTELKDTSSRIIGATKDSFLQELRTGDNGVLILIAHSDGEKIYLPGTRGETVSRDEIAQIAREEAPNRLIILLSCSVGTVNEPKLESIAESIIRNRLAKAVFASPKPVDARKSPELLRELLVKGTPPRPLLQRNGINEIVFRRGEELSADVKIAVARHL